MNLKRLTRLLHNAPISASGGSAPDVDGQGNAIEIETGLLLYAMVLRLRPCAIIETGTHRGYSSAWMASALADIRENGPSCDSARMYTVDGNGYDGRPEALWKELGVSELVTHKISNSWDVDFGDLGRIVDFMWLDADHSGDSIVREFYHFKPFLVDGCVVGFHDTHLDARMHPGIQAIIDTCPGRVEQLSFRNMRGVDFIQVWHTDGEGPRRHFDQQLADEPWSKLLATAKGLARR